MRGKLRYIYPGNNTPQGFFSYYDYILGQMEAKKIFCLKGGPGTGKSTFMKKIGEEMLENGYHVDFMMCSSDPNSLDGIVIKELGVAMMDGTAPHMVDPKNPGAVDSIINLGEFWNEDGIRKNKQNILRSNATIGSFFKRAYNYLGAAGKMHDNLRELYEKAFHAQELYKTSASIVHKELAHVELSGTEGNVKKYFASAITPGGLISQVKSLIHGYEKVYLIENIVGAPGEKLFETFLENAIARGLNAECYYCPMRPDTKLEHLLIPSLGLAFTTSNHFHPMEIPNAITIHISEFLNQELLSRHQEFIDDCNEKMEELIQRAIDCIQSAKKEHDILEEQYIPHMNFKDIEEYRQQFIHQLLSQKQ